ncbi:AmpG permease [Hyphomicrobium sulfonivorans]|uniref:AmpG permease n=1 Tax=Hyphomicrobium sulfonivorans TaxID=121290 RepID=A0A109BI11_HYPSL|nr:MFS transporter [Hyphomicrobium sulfonivorans]KWT69214.1 AmpG permease [Hyphomicrobium sulfonivorans]
MSAPTQSEPQPGRSYLDALTVYLRPSVLVIMLLGFSSGLPLALSGETLRVWMADSGVDLGTIGLLSLAGLPYTLKFLWAPVVDAWQVPFLSRHFGRRRAWLIASQLVLMAAIVFLGTRDPISAPWMIGLGAVIVAMASATQDIVVDAYRVQALPTDEQAAGMAGYVAAYRIGMLASGAGVIGFSAWLETQGIPTASVWPLAYAAAALLVLVGLFGSIVAREPQSARDLAAAEQDKEGSPIYRLFETARGAFADFLTSDAALAVLAFVILFKLCDALAGTMTAPFVLSLGYSKATYAAIVKGVGLAALLAGGFAGGAVARALPLSTALWIAAFLQMGSNLVFVWLGYQTPSAGALTVAIVVENFAGAIGTVIFVAYLSALCRNPLHTATQYALLTALASTGRTFFASGTGYMVKLLDWPLFFIATSLTALPALMLLVWLQRRGHFRSLENGNGS